MMQQASGTMAAERPTWRRIIDFPLVALVISAALYIGATVLGAVAGKYVPPSLGPQAVAIAHAALIIVPVVLVYKLVIVRLGEQPRDDLRWNAEAGKNLGLGLLIGFLIMASAVAIAAIVGVYRITGPGDTSRVVLELVATAIMPGIMEELAFRGILFRWIEDFGVFE